MSELKVSLRLCLVRIYEIVDICTPAGDSYELILSNFCSLPRRGMIHSGPTPTDFNPIDKSKIAFSK